MASLPDLSLVHSEVQQRSYKLHAAELGIVIVLCLSIVAKARARLMAPENFYALCLCKYTGLAYPHARPCLLAALSCSLLKLQLYG